MSIVAAFAVPHPPLIIPGVGSGKEKIASTIAAYDEVGRRVAELAPDTVVISTRLGFLKPGSLGRRMASGCWPPSKPAPLPPPARES